MSVSGMSMEASIALSKILSSLIYGLVRIFRDEENGFPITITVMRWSSNFRLLSFIVEILNAEAGRNLEVIQRQGALLLIENGQLLHVELPKEGVEVETFFETSKVRETLLIATRNEGKTEGIPSYL